MKVIELSEAKNNLDVYARECQSSPVIVTVDGKPAFELIPVRAEDAEFIDRLLESNAEFRALAEQRHHEGITGQVSSLDAVRERLREMP